MEINFNNLRKELAQEYNDLIKILNKGTSEDYIYNNGVSGNVLTDGEEIREPLDNIRSLIATLAACYNGRDVDDISDEIKLELFDED